MTLLVKELLRKDIKFSMTVKYRTGPNWEVMFLILDVLNDGIE